MPAQQQLHAFECCTHSNKACTPMWLLQLADFGFSKDANQHSAPTSRVGTPAYLAPEVISNQPGQVYDGQVGTVAEPSSTRLWVAILVIFSYYNHWRPASATPLHDVGCSMGIAAAPPPPHTPHTPQ